MEYRELDDFLGDGPYGIDERKLSEVERRFIDSVKSGRQCVLEDTTAAPAANEITDWSGQGRKIRAAVFRHVLMAQDIDGPSMVNLHGAIIAGTLDLCGDAPVPPFRLTFSRIDGIQASSCRFRGELRLDGVVCSGAVNFTRAIFDGDCYFDSAILKKEAWFGRCRFSKDASFIGVEMAEHGWFDKAVFGSRVHFSRAKFSKKAWFAYTTFCGPTTFEELAFTQDADFSNAIFADNVHFQNVSFEAAARFANAAFAASVRFREVAFNGPARFVGVVVDRLNLTDTDIYQCDPWTIMARELYIERSNFRCTGVIIWGRVARFKCRNSQVASSSHIRLQGAEIDLSGTEFSGRNIVSGPGDEQFHMSVDEVMGPLPEVSSTYLRARQQAQQAALERFKAIEIETTLLPKPRLISLVGTTVGELTLAQLDLTDCRFLFAHQLDKLRVDASCDWPKTPRARTWKRPFRFTKRSIIAEEGAWRSRQHSAWDSNQPSFQAPDALAIAGLYRSLRKGLEDGKNEPGAADFYYGEMEMRRLAGRRSRASSAEEESSAPRSANKNSPAERLILTLYWAVSGYGLRASRAFSVLIGTITVATFIFSEWGIDSTPAKSAQPKSIDIRTGEIVYGAQNADHGLLASFEFALHDSVALLRSTTAPPLTTLGVFTEIALRLLAPILLGFAALALRGRVKR